VGEPLVIVVMVVVVVVDMANSLIEQGFLDDT
jgi:hypothetical protein